MSEFNMKRQLDFGTIDISDSGSDHEDMTNKIWEDLGRLNMAVVSLTSLVETIQADIRSIMNVMTATACDIHKSPSQPESGKSAFPPSKDSTVTNNKGDKTDEGLPKSELPGNVTAKRLFSPAKGPSIESPNSVCYTDYAPRHGTKYVKRTSGVIIPPWIPVVFTPPNELKLDEIEAAVAAYIFGKNKDDARREVLVRTKVITVDSGALLTLALRENVDQDVLNLVAYVMTYKQDRTIMDYPDVWFLPTMFSQYALSWKDNPVKAMTQFQRDYMGKMEYLSRIFVPINDNNVHWFLLIVDINNRKLILLDSLPETGGNKRRIDLVKQVAYYMEIMLKEPSFYINTINYPPPIITRFKLFIPDDIGRQRNNDCGIWVAEWMTSCVWEQDYAITVTNATRMKLAIDLVIRSHNLIEAEIIRRAFQNWNELKEKHSRLVVRD